MLAFIPGAGALTAIGVNSSLNLLYTWRFGAALVRLFDRPDFSDLDLDEILRFLLLILPAAPIPHVSELQEIGEIIFS